jgi:dUTP pyrophosphatase
MALRQGITCLNTPGTIDSDYRGEVGVILINLDNKEHTIFHGDRVAQLVFQAVASIRWNPVESIGESDRGAGGFGHTGRQ